MWMILNVPESAILKTNFQLEYNILDMYELQI